MSVFEASPEGFRAQNLGRPAAHLVRELIQNVLDEPATKCLVAIKHTPKKGTFIRVADDVYGGFRDESLVFTIWASDKQDSPTKRGRMGRGLKELVSVSDWTSVSTQGRSTILFERSKQGEWKRKTTSTIPSPGCGSVVEAQISAWSSKDAKAIEEYLSRLRPPTGVRLVVNGKTIERRPAIERHPLYLPSVTYVVEDGERRVSNRSFLTDVELLADDGEHWIYEMGIPIETIDFPLSIDVGQRVPLREQRDTLLSWYKSELFAKLVSARIDHLPAETLRDNYVLKAAESSSYLSEQAKQRIATAWTEGKPYASSPQMMSIATGQHLPVVNLRTLPEAVRELVRATGQDVRQVLEARRTELCPPLVPTAAQQRFIDRWEWIAKGIHRPCRVVIAGGNPGAEASFDRTSSTLTVYAKNVAPDFFDHPYKTKQLAVLIHELSHWKALEESHGADFHSDAENVGAEVCVWLMEHYFEAIDENAR